MTALELHSEQQKIVDVFSQTQESGRKNIYDVKITTGWKVAKIISEKYKKLASNPNFYVNATGTNCSTFWVNSWNININNVYSNFLSWIKEFLASRELPHNIDAIKQNIFKETWLNPDIFDFKEINAWIVESAVWKVTQKTDVASYEMQFKKWLTKQELEEEIDKALLYQLVPEWKDWEWKLAILKQDYIILLESIFWKI